MTTSMNVFGIDCVTVEVSRELSDGSVVRTFHFRNGFGKELTVTAFGDAQIKVQNDDDWQDEAYEPHESNVVDMWRG